MLCYVRKKTIMKRSRFEKKGIHFTAENIRFLSIAVVQFAQESKLNPTKKKNCEESRKRIKPTPTTPNGQP